MQTKTLFTALYLLLLSTNLFAYDRRYPDSKFTIHPAVQQYTNPYHNSMKELAAHPALAYNDALVDKLLNYIDQCWSSDKHDIMGIVASNQGAYTNPRLTGLTQQELLYQRKQKALKNAFTLGTLAIAGTVALMYIVLNQFVLAHQTKIHTVPLSL